MTTYDERHVAHLLALQEAANRAATEALAARERSRQRLARYAERTTR